MKKISFVFCVSLVVMLIAMSSLIFLNVSLSNAEAATQDYEKIELLNQSLKNELKTTKTLKDFNNNLYTVAEYEPTGYVIYCDYNNEILESAQESLSPYLNFEENLYYLGPCQYYYKDKENNLIHTITKNIYNYKNEEKVLKAQSTKLYNKLTQKRENSYGISTLASSSGYVSNHTFFNNLKTSSQMSYISGGYCGYIAATILLGYYDTFRSDSFIPDNSIMQGTGVNRYFINKDLVNELIAIGANRGYDNSSTSTTIRHIMNDYFSKHNINAKSYDMITPFFSISTIRKSIDKDVPIILFGKFEQPNKSLIAQYEGNHTVVVYGYQQLSNSSQKWSLIVHYGWSGYSSVYINDMLPAILGSMYNIKY